MDRYLSEREDLLRVAVPGITSARRLARLTDEALLQLATDAAARLPKRVRWSLIALGGYGSGALLPESDVDLLVVSDAKPATVRPFVEAILYPLWDAGLAVGHQVRTRRDQLRAVREDTATLTATLTGRVIAGDDRLGVDVLGACASDAAKRASTVLVELQARERPGSPYLLEPDLKEGAGGRRDLDELTWTAAILTGSPQSDPSALVSLGLLSEADFTTLETAADAVASARWELHLMDSGSLMSIDSAEDMRTDPSTVQRALADTHHILMKTRRRVSESDRADTGPIPASTVLDLALSGAPSLSLLEEAVWSGRFEPLVPGMRDLMVLRRPGLAHTLTVGAHCLLSATLIGDIVRGHADDELARRSAASIPDPRIVIVAALVHDIGKETPGPDHADRGASTARAVAGRMGLDEYADEVAALVRFHLLLAQTAGHADLDDEDTVLKVAQAIGNRALVAPLHVLTAADSIATGPGAWSQWHAALIGKLVARLDSALSSDVDGAGLVEHADRIRANVAEALAPDDERAPLLDAVPLRFLATRSAEEILRHLDLAAKVLRERSPSSFALDVTVGPVDGTYRATIAAIDRPGLFATLAGVFALSGLDILGTEAGSGTREIALDTFTVRSATLAPVDHEAWIRFERLLGLALKDRLAIGVRLAERARHYSGSRHRRPPETLLSADDPFAAVLRVRASDRVGLLYEIARAITESGLNISSATVITRDGVAEDVFRLTDDAGEAPREAGVLGQLQMRLRALR